MFIKYVFKKFRKYIFNTILPIGYEKKRLEIFSIKILFSNATT